MPVRPLSEDPSLENLKKRAKKLRDAVRAGDAESLARVREFHPRATEALAALAGFSLSDAQLVAARAYGFASWPKLKQHLAVVERFVWDPPTDPAEDADAAPLVDAFVRLACVSYGEWHPSRAERARRLLAEHPEIAGSDLYAAATAGDVVAARALLARDPALAKAKGGALGWEPLLYACYSRLDSEDPGHSTLEVARLLVAAGADPNAGFLWRGNVPPFTALTGAFGEGEDGTNQPPHQHRDELARLLLDAGADPNDGQTLYNRHFREDDGHLQLLFSYGLGQDRGGPWFRRLGDRLMSPGKMLVEELWAAARKNFPERVRLLVEHGTEVDAPGFRNGRTPYEEALLAGNREIADHLLQNGARKVELDSKEAFAAACVAGQSDEARAHLKRDPKLLEALGPHGRIELVRKAVEARRPEAVRLMADLGFELSTLTRNTPLHDAAWAGDLDMVKLLIELGADPNLRDRSYNATPLGWAEHNGQREVAEYLLALPVIEE
jgi:ankyrin repeat protein